MLQNACKRRALDHGKEGRDVELLQLIPTSMPHGKMNNLNSAWEALKIALQLVYYVRASYRRLGEHRSHSVRVRIQGGGISSLALHTGAAACAPSSASLAGGACTLGPALHLSLVQTSDYFCHQADVFLRMRKTMKPS